MASDEKDISESYMFRGNLLKILKGLAYDFYYIRFSKISV